MSDIVSLLNEDFAEQERKNREKYGPRGGDHIASCFKKSTQTGNIWCSENAIKYITRFARRDVCHISRAVITPHTTDAVKNPRQKSHFLTFSISFVKFLYQF